MHVRSAFVAFLVSGKHVFLSEKLQFLCFDAFVLKAGGDCQWTLVFIRFVDRNHERFIGDLCSSKSGAAATPSRAS
jgi:hypothetical protein